MFLIECIILYHEKKIFIEHKKLISKKTVLYEMSDITAYDIDNILDLRINKSLINRFKKKLMRLEKIKILETDTVESALKKIQEGSVKSFSC